MGLRMSKAYSNRLKRDVTIDEAIKKTIKDELFCSNEKCRIPLTFVEPFTRKSSIVNGYFRRKGTVEHSDECNYNTFGQINIAARDSEGALTSIDNKKYSLRLNLISTAIKNSASLKVQKESNSIIENKKTPSKDYISSGKISSYLSTMKKIMQIKSKIEDEKELRNLLEIQLGNKTIKWTEFYFEFNEYEKCFEKINTNKINYPICIEGEIKKFEKATENFPLHSIKLKLRLLEQVQKDIKRYVAVSILLDDDLLFENLKKEYENGKKYVSFCSNMKTKSVKSKNEFFNIMGRVYNKKQIHIY